MKGVDSSSFGSGSDQVSPRSEQDLVEEVKFTNKKVMYFKPESILLAHPDVQKAYREKLMKQIKGVPKIAPPRLLAEELQEQFIEVVADRSDPREMRRILETYFKRKEYSLKHKKYKLLMRWAHHSTSSRNLDHLA